MYTQVWRYNEGDVTHIGVGHSGDVSGVKISPDGRHIVSVSEDGAILRWRYPFNDEDEAPPSVEEQEERVESSASNQN